MTIDIPALRALLAAANLRGPLQLGEAGSRNLVTFDGDDIVGIGSVNYPPHAAIICAAVSALPALLDRMEALEGQLSWACSTLENAADIIDEEFGDDEESADVRDRVREARELLAGLDGKATPSEGGLGDLHTTDYCLECGQSPDSGSHLPHGHGYRDPRVQPKARP